MMKHIAILFHCSCYLAPGGGCDVLFSPCLCLYVCVSGQYFGILFPAIGRDIDLKFIQDTYRAVLNSQTKLTFIGQRSRLDGRYIAF